jgi:hypothetical protein
MIRLLTMTCFRAAALVLIFASSPASAWGPVGHMAVGMIAESRLSPRTRDAVRGLLGSATLDDVSNCADSFAYGKERGCPCTNQGRCEDEAVFQIPGDFEASKPWHFIDIDVEKRADESTVMDFCPPQGCAVPEIKKALTVLSAANSTRHAKQVALMWLVHFVGDIHQPLHAAEHRHDAGGNKKKVDVEYKGRSLNLHSAWDQALDPPARVAFDSNVPDRHASLRREARLLANGLSEQLGAADEDSATAAGDELVHKIVIESWKIAKDKIYPRYAQDHGKVAGESRGDYAAGPDGYKTVMQPVAYRRVKLAGVRLAAMLEQTLGRLPADAAAEPAPAAR